MNDYHNVIVELARAALREDVGKGDLTSLACLLPDTAEGTIVAKSDGVLSGVEAATTVFEMVDSANTINFKKVDGDSFQAGDVIAEIEGLNQTILASERTALNFLGHLSGIATLTHAFVDKLKGTRAQLLDTRKTTPGWRLLEKKAVVDGGGHNHRIGLFDMILIKDNHIASAGSIADAISQTREYLDSPDFRLQFETKAEDILIEVEVTNEAQLKEAIEAGVDRLLLDNQTIPSLTQLVKTARALNPEIKLEASGNVTLETIADIAATGVDFISAGAITHSAPAADFSLRLTER